MTLLPRKTSFRWKGISSLQAPKKKRKKGKENRRKREESQERKKERARKVVESGVTYVGGEERKYSLPHIHMHILLLRERRYESTITWHLRADSAFTSVAEFGTFTRGLLWLGRGFLTMWWKARDEFALWSNILIPQMELSLGNLDLLPKLLRTSHGLQRCRIPSLTPRWSYLAAT